MSRMTALTWSDLPIFSISSFILRSSVMRPDTVTRATCGKRLAARRRRDRPRDTGREREGRAPAPQAATPSRAASAGGGRSRFQRREPFILAQRTRGPARTLCARLFLRRGARLGCRPWRACACAWLAGSSSSSSSPFALFRAAPRISPSEAPESVEPYWATASFSSAISSALIETETLRVLASTWVTTASNFSPTPKRSGRCSERSRDRSDRRMKVREVMIDELGLEPVVLDGESPRTSRACPSSVSPKARLRRTGRR